MHGNMNVKYIGIFSDRTTNSENRAKIHLRLYGKLRLSQTDFHETENCITGYRADFIYRISPKLVNKYGKCAYYGSKM